MKVTEANAWALGMAAALLQSDLDGDLSRQLEEDPDGEIKQRQFKKLIATLRARGDDPDK